LTGPRLSAEQRSALRLLAGDPHGATEELLVLAHGFNGDMIAGLVRTGLATAQREMMKAGGKTVEGVRIMITQAGRGALNDEGETGVRSDCQDAPPRRRRYQNQAGRLKQAPAGVETA
jgi:hypothetical protein